jgi:Domain of unknown function (DUF4396)
MEHHHHERHGSNSGAAAAAHSAQHHAPSSLNRTAFSATVHCLTGCAIGEVLGMVIGTGLGMANWATVVLSVALAFIFGYALTMLPLVRRGIPPTTAAALAFASDTASIALMEVVDNVIMVYIPGAMDAGPMTALFWGSLIASLLIAGAMAFPLNRWLIRRGLGHAVIHGYRH